MKASDARHLALSFPETEEAPHFEFDSFRVRGKIFATLAPDGQHLHVFVDEALRESALVLHADCLEKLWWGQKVMGLRVHLPTAKAAVVRQLLANAWKRKAPKRVVAEFDARGPS